jgi:hypothetical protein
MTRFSRRTLLVAAVVLCAPTAPAADMVGVDGSETTFPTQIESTIGGKAVKLNLTGAALRRRVIFKVYTIGSYVDAGARLRSAGEVVAADRPKQLHLVMERDVSGKDLAEAVEKAIHQGRGDNAFPGELKSLGETMRALELKKGDNVWLTSVPRKGLDVDVAGKKQLAIENPDFAKAVWEIYFGEKNIDNDVKKALVSRL